MCVRRRVRSETRPSVDLRLLEAVALGEPLSVREVDARGERRVLLHQLQGIVPHLSLEREREEALGVAWRRWRWRVEVVVEVVEVVEVRWRWRR